MQLIKLEVYKNGVLLRDVSFKKGLNLIVNSASSIGQTGNSVGKSTLSRLIDYIFLSKGDDIYTEPEFKKNIPEVYDFITQNTVYIALSFLGHDNKEHNLGRTLTIPAKEAALYIDGQVVEKKDYFDLLSKQVFGYNSEKPSIRNISHKFIRNTNEKMQNTTRFLHVNARPDVYDQLYLYLFGFTGMQLLAEKADFNNKIKNKNKHLTAYRIPHRESALLKMINPLKKEEKSLTEKIDNFDFKESEKANVNQLVLIQNSIAEATLSYSKILTRISYLQKSIEKIKSKATSVDGRELSTIYEEAGVVLNNEVKQSYENLILFHNEVIANKINLLNSDLSPLVEKEKSIKKKLDELHENESTIYKDINKADTLKSIGQIYNELSSVKEKIASINALLRKIEDTKSQIKAYEEDKMAIINSISENTERLDANVEKFNEFFGQLCKKFYDEIYIFDLEFDQSSEKCRFDIANASPNSVGGKKKGELSAFDLAYIEFINSVKLKRPSFVIHDSIEDVDVNQVFDIFQHADSLDGQYIVSLLVDKISQPQFDSFKETSIILELSEQDKFFKI